MKTFNKALALLLIMCSLLFCFNVRAALQQENIPLEGELDTRDMRSIDKKEKVKAFLNGANINIEFEINISKVVINIKDTNNTIIYTKTVPSPQYESISLEGLESGCYTLELSADTGYMYGTFMYVY